MTEQEKMEKVIKGLECCLGDTRTDLPNLCTICPYAHGSYATQTCGKKQREDALVLLKAQEPRVMTLEEYEAWIDTPFTDRNPVFHEERTKRGTVTCWVNTVVCTLREYGKNDRCWTSRPTDEQREKEPWNG